MADANANTNKNILKQIYYNYSSPGSLSTLKKLRTEVEKEIGKVSDQTISDFLLSQKPYSLFQKRKRTFPRRFIWIKNKFQTVTVDLADLSRLSTYNKNYKWIFVASDLTSNMLYLEALKQKSTNEVKQAFANLIAFSQSYGGKIEKIWSDRGNLCVRVCVCVCASECVCECVCE